jgi:hypothetical protein
VRTSNLSTHASSISVSAYPRFCISIYRSTNILFTATVEAARADSMSRARSFADSPHHFESGRLQITISNGVSLRKCRGMLNTTRFTSFDAHGDLQNPTPASRASRY